MLAPERQLTRPRAPRRQRRSGRRARLRGPSRACSVCSSVPLHHARSPRPRWPRTGTGLGFLGLASASAPGGGGLLGGRAPATAADRDALPTTPGHLPELDARRRRRRHRRRLRQPHLFERRARSGRPARGRLSRTTRPGSSSSTERCAPLVTSYLGEPLDPDGRYRVGALKPTRPRGTTATAAALRAAGRVPLRRAVPAHRQGRRRRPGRRLAPGTCLGLAGKEVGDPVSTARGTHAVEAVGIVDLGAKFPDALPAVDDQDTFLQPACTKVAKDRGRRAEAHRQEAHRLLGQPHRGLLGRRHPQGQLQPGRAARRQQRVRPAHRLGEGRRDVGGEAPATTDPLPPARRARRGPAGGAAPPPPATATPPPRPRRCCPCAAEPADPADPAARSAVAGQQPAPTPPPRRRAAGN